MEPPSAALGFGLSVFFSAYLGLAAACLRATTREDLEVHLGASAEPSLGQRVFLAWQRDRRFVASALQLGQLFANLSTAIFALGMADAFLGNARGWVVATAGFSVSLVAAVVFGQLVPKVLASWKPTAFLTLLALASPLYAVLHALRKVLDHTAKVGAHLVGGDPSRLERTVSAEEFEVLLKGSENHSGIDAEQRELLESVFEFRDTRVHDVMVPRTDTRFVDVDSTLDEVLDLVAEEGYSRYPVYRDTVDQIVGVFFVKDLIPYLRGPIRSPFRLAEYLRPAFFVPESKRVSELMREFQLRKIHLAIVVDEFGGTAGIVSIEDIIEVIFGDIYDEYDEEADEPGVERTSDGRFLADARVPIRELALELGTSFPDPDAYDTLGGFIVTAASRVPAKGFELEWGGHCFRVVEADNTRVRKVEIRPSAPREGAGSPGRELAKG